MNPNPVGAVSDRDAAMARGLRRLLQVLLMLCLPLLAQAQFQKSPWPARQVAPALDLTDLQGQRWTSASLRGRTVVLNFWATWCPPCREEMPSLQTLHELGGGDPVVIGINVREPASRVRRYLDAAGVQFPVVLDPQGELAKRFDVKTYPTTLLMAPDGQIRWRVVGEVDWAGPEAWRWVTELGSPRR